jgi:hypothetical protein
MAADIETMRTSQNKPKLYTVTCESKFIVLTHYTGYLPSFFYGTSVHYSIY